MAIDKALIRVVDRVLFRAMTADLPLEHVDRYVKHLAVDHDETSVPNVIGRGFQIIDGKASALLTHTSMMVAALGISARVVAEDYFEQGVIVAEIMLYLLVALGCLRCLSMFQDDLDAPKQEAARNELIFRHKLFRLCNRATIFMTLLVLVSLPLLYFYVPAKTV
jgi:uncharacterized membrane protein